jgi:hypothetical protein
MNVEILLEHGNAHGAPHCLEISRRTAEVCWFGEDGYGGRTAFLVASRMLGCRQIPTNPTFRRRAPFDLGDDRDIRPAERRSE